jgi:hypothetical protein
MSSVHETQTIYVVTHHRFNHQERNKPIDPRFIKSSRRYVYYLIDAEAPPELSNKDILFEDKIDPLIKEASRLYFAEWGLLLNEERYSMLHYPFFMISSRFYEKNRTLRTTLDLEWDNLFSCFQSYRWGFLPSYEKPNVWVDAHTAEIKMDLYIAPKGNELIREIYGVDICNHSSYRYIGDFFCHYIGFRDRSALLEFVDFAKPLINYFFDKHFQPIRDLSEYVRFTGGYRNEKPFTFMLEALSQLFFLVKKHRYFGMKYDGYFDIDPSSRTALRIKSLETGSSMMSRIIDLDGQDKMIHVVQERKRALPCRTVPSNSTRPYENLIGNEVLLAKFQSIAGKHCSMLNVLPLSGAVSVEAARAGMFVITLDNSDYTLDPISCDLWSQLSTQTFSIDPDGLFSIRDSHQKELKFDVILFSRPPNPNLLSEALRHLAPDGMLVSPRSINLNDYARAHNLTEEPYLTSVFEHDYPTNERSKENYSLAVYVPPERPHSRNDFKVAVSNDIYVQTAGLFLSKALQTQNRVLLEHALHYARQITGTEGKLLEAASCAYLGRAHEAIPILHNLRERFTGDAQVENVYRALSPLLCTHLHTSPS